MASLQHFSSLVSSLQESILDPEQIQVFMASLSSSLKASHCYFVASAPGQSFHWLQLHGFTPRETQDYADYYVNQDLALQQTASYLEQNGRWLGQLEDILPVAEMTRSEIYNDYMTPIDLHRQASVAYAGVGPYEMVGCAVWRGRNSSPYSAEDLQLLGQLGPHLRQAMLLRARLGEMNAKALIFDAALEANHVAVIAFDSACRILSMSTTARRIIERSEGLREDGGELRAASSYADVALRGAIHRAVLAVTAPVKLAQAGKSLPGGTIAIPRPEPLPDLCAYVFPFRSPVPSFSHNAAALVFLYDPAAELPQRADVLRTLYSLTPAEARLCDVLLEGYSVREAAERFGNTYETTRFYLKQIFRKTGTARQTDLTRLLLSLPGSISASV